MLRIGKIESEAELAALEQQWRRLEGSTSLPFKTWEWSMAWWARLREQRASVVDTLFVRTIRDENDELVAVAPLMLTKRPSFGPLCVRQLQFFGADPNLTEVRGLVVAPNAEEAAYGALLRHIRECANDWDFASLSGIASPRVRRLAEDLFPTVELVRELPCYELELPGTWEDLKQRLSRNIKESLRKCYNSLKRDGLAWRFEVLESPADIDGAFDDFFVLHQARAARSDTVSHPNAFCSEATRDFLRDVGSRFAQNNQMRLFRLWIGDKVVAARIAFIVENKLYLYYSGYDPDFAKYSVMTTTVAEAIKYAISQGFSHVNLSTGTDVSKTRWGPTESKTSEISVVSPSARGHAVHQLYTSLKSASKTNSLLTLPMRLLGRRAFFPTVSRASQSSG